MKEEIIYGITIFGILTTVIILTIMGAIKLEKNHCEYIANEYNTEKKFTAVHGCWIKIDGRYIEYKKIREV